MSDVNSKITIVIPAKNEEQTIGEILDKILLNFSGDRIVIIVDEITDRTIEIAKQKSVRVISGKTKGKGAAIKLAIDSLASDILVFIDADGSHKPQEIPKLVQPIINNEADLVIGSRIKGGSEELSGSINNRTRYIGNIISNFLINLMWVKDKTKITDCQNGFRAIKGNIAKQLNLKEDGFAIEQEMVIKCLEKGYRIREIPSYELKRQYGNSRIKPIMICRYIWCLTKNAIKYHV